MPSACSTCIDQERTSENPDASYSFGQGEQRYGLRERVAHLENIVQGLVRRLDGKPSSNSPGKSRGKRLHKAQSLDLYCRQTINRESDSRISRIRQVGPV